jgi:hypothetical protein
MKMRNICAEDRIIFHIPLETKLTQSTESLQTWVKNIEPIVRICMKKQEERIRNQHNDIRSFFLRPDIQQQEGSVSDADAPHSPSAHDKEQTQARITRHDDDLSPITTHENPPVTHEQRTYTEKEGIYMLFSSGEMYPPDRVETPRVGDTDRAASQQE